ncbi:YlmH/Sll1252 family protein [Candidatus Epulonipiscium viviparus]|uniref:YlmH/Sll1252 family protein n=1 Tax=Candidatus Epulonipiscium viviparus TaxID=420336 RepID=UPI00273814D1|nr:YlmH/Sll1252 family protein [Candidatus Epulopiscium viviparus]
MKINWENIKSAEEKLFLKTISKYESEYREFFTDFYETDWANGVLSKYTTDFYLLGGYPEASRSIVCITPFDEPLVNPIAILKIDVKTGFGKELTHRDFLGSILSLGISRAKIGDIVVTSFGAYVFCHIDVAEYIRFNLSKIARFTKIETSIISNNELEIPVPKFTEITTSVSSLRVDVILCAIFNLSRNESSKLIKSEKAKLNGLVINNSSFSVKTGDTLTLRGYGKLILDEIGGLSKKKKIYIKVKRF